MDPVLREAQAFMDAYAKDLIAGDREALWRRYDPRGSYWLGAGRKLFATPEQAKERYLKLWKPPQTFAWKDLSFEVVGPDAVVVAGRFEWGRNGTVTPCSYSSLLLKREGRWVIRLEDESAAPLPPSPPPSKTK